MNASTAFGILIGITAGVLAATFLGPVILPYGKQGVSELKVAKGINLRIHGKVLKMDSAYIYLNKEPEHNETRSIIKIGYDKNTLMLVRNRKTDEQDQVVESLLLTGPADAVVRVGEVVYLSIWVTEKRSAPYALQIFGSI